MVSSCHFGLIVATLAVYCDELLDDVGSIGTTKSGYIMSGVIKRKSSVITSISSSEFSKLSDAAYNVYYSV